MMTQAIMTLWRSSTSTMPSVQVCTCWYLLLISSPELLLEALFSPLEVVQLDVREQHSVKAYEQVGEASIGCLPASLCWRCPHAKDRLPRSREWVQGNHAAVRGVSTG